MLIYNAQTVNVNELYDHNVSQYTFTVEISSEFIFCYQHCLNSKVEILLVSGVETDAYLKFAKYWTADYHYSNKVENTLVINTKLLRIQ